VIELHGMPAVRWTGAGGAAATAMLQGAQLVSWIPAGGAESIFVSERSPFEPGRAIRGGVPVVFPQFAERGPLANHGFARTQSWRLASEEGGRAVFELASSAETLRLWPHAFALGLAIEVSGTRLRMELRVRNIGEGAFSFNAALHTYLRVRDAAKVRLEGLEGTRYVDRGSAAPGVETRRALDAAEPVDRVYLKAPRETRLADADREIVISQAGFPDTVVWNPGRERTASMADMPSDGYRRMLCVEAAAFESPIGLQPAGEWTGSQEIAVSGLPP
jgi:glucose-6-phosphate 1-epimerase